MFLNHQLAKKSPPSFEEENALPKLFKAQKIVFVYYLIDFFEQHCCQEATEEPSIFYQFAHMIAKYFYFLSQFS